MHAHVYTTFHTIKSGRVRSLYSSLAVGFLKPWLVIFLVLKMKKHFSTIKKWKFYFSTIKRWKFHFSRGEKSEGRRSGTVGRLTLTQIDAFYVPSMASPTNFFSPQNKRVWKAGRNSYTQALWYQKIKTSPCHILNKKSTGTTKTQRELCWHNRKFEADYFISGNCIEKVQESRQRVTRRVYTKDFERRKRLSIIIEDE